MTTRNQPAARFHVRWLPLDALTPDPRNARVHSARQIARIADSIAAFGFNAPVLVDGQGGVLAGHGRLLAARRLGLKEIPTIALDHLTETQARAFMLADNRLGELATWDDGRLRLELEELKSLDLDFALEATGFELSEIDLRIEADRPPGKRKLKSPAARAIARAGDAWTLGPHRLVCGDDDATGFSAIDAAMRRWQAVTGQNARLYPSGETFDAVVRGRRIPSPAAREKVAGGSRPDEGPHA
jgi:ParB-like chromosome segregation protein Spo0J